MTEQLTLMLNGKEYELSNDFKRKFEERAEREFEGNHYLDYFWSENERGDPILNIETSGVWVPMNRIERLSPEMVEQENADNSDPDDSDDSDSDDVTSVPKDNVDMSEEPEELEEPDTSFLVTPPDKEYIPEPEEEGEKIPPAPEEVPDEPAYVKWLPADDCEEIWETGQAIVPIDMSLEWNLQRRADEAPEGSTKMSVGDDGHVDEVPRFSRHDHFESLARSLDCEVIAEQKPSDTPPTNPSDSYEGEEAEETLDGKYGGSNWNV